MPGSITLITPQTDQQPPLVSCCSDPISVTCRMHCHFVADFQGFSHAKQLVLTRTRRHCFTNFALGPRTLGRATPGSPSWFCNRGHPGAMNGRTTQVQAPELKSQNEMERVQCTWAELHGLMLLFSGWQALPRTV